MTRAQACPGFGGFACRNRRQVLQIGSLGLLGLTLPNFFRLHAAETSLRLSAGASRAKRCILLFCWGGPSQLETWDPKPDAPAEIRGPFRPIATRVPGLHISEHLPRLAQQAHRLAIIRSLHHNQSAHAQGAYFMLTGQGPPASFVVSTTNWPTLGSMIGYLRSGNPSLPNNVMVPYHLHDPGVPQRFFAGQHAGFLGPGYQPFVYFPRGGTPYPGMSADDGKGPMDLNPLVPMDRLPMRLELLRGVNRLADPWAAAPSQAYRKHFHKALNLLADPKVSRAFDLDREPAPLRQRYGGHIAGRSLLVARRLAEAGVPLVTVVCAAGNAGVEGSWDTHNNNADRLKNVLLPPLDQGASALLDDLAQRGMLDETLIVIAGEFGRTPRPQNGNGRDHWPGAFSVVLAGGGVRGGQVHGSTDKFAAYPKDSPVTPADFIATILYALGIDPHAELHDRLDRPVLACTGEPLGSLFAG